MLDTHQKGLKQIRRELKNHEIRNEQAGAELCQAQVKLEAIVDFVEEAWN